MGFYLTTITFDFECSTKNKANPFTASGKSVSYSIKLDDRPSSFNYFNEIEFLRELREGFEQAKLFVGFNIKFDFHWARRLGIVPNERARVWDCQIAQFLIQGQQGAYPSLDECLAKYGLGQKDDKIAEYWKLGIDTQDIPIEELKYYNNLDTELTYKLYLIQQEVMSEKQKKLCLLMGLDLLVLEEMEWNGIKFDVELCEKKLAEAKEKFDNCTEELLVYSPTPLLNLDSGQHLSCLLYGGEFEIDFLTPTERIYKSGPNKGLTYIQNKHELLKFNCNRLFKPLEGTAAKLPMKLSSGEQVWYRTDEDTLKKLKTPSKQHKQIIETLLERAEVGKLIDTYYGKLPQLLETMEWGEYLHGQYNQVVAATGRLSSTGPNMQNFSGEVDRLLVTRFN